MVKNNSINFIDVLGLLEVKTGYVPDSPVGASVSWFYRKPEAVVIKDKYGVGELFEYNVNGRTPMDIGVIFYPVIKAASGQSTPSDSGCRVEASLKPNQ